MKGSENKMTQKKAFGGYVGDYNGHLLKSSYEYIFAQILEYDGIEYGVEDKTYLLEEGETYYTPDFFLYDEDGLYEIIEIRGHRFNLEERVESLIQLQKVISEDIVTNLYTELDLREMCRDRDMSYNKLKMDWRNNPDNVRGLAEGRANSMFGRPQKESTKLLIKQLADERVRKDPQKYTDMAKSMVKYGRDNNYDFLRGDRVPRFTLVCELCGKEFKVIQGMKNKRRFCSQQCGSESSSVLGAEKAVQIRKDRDERLNSFIFEWAGSNAELILSTPFNQITPTLKPLLKLIEDEFDVIDFRTISRSLGTKHRKDFLRELQEYVS